MKLSRNWYHPLVPIHHSTFYIHCKRNLNCDFCVGVWCVLLPVLAMLCVYGRPSGKIAFSWATAMVNVYICREALSSRYLCVQGMYSATVYMHILYKERVVGWERLYTKMWTTRNCVQQLMKAYIESQNTLQTIATESARANCLIYGQCI